MVIDLKRKAYQAYNAKNHESPSIKPPIKARRAFLKILKREKIVPDNFKLDALSVTIDDITFQCNVDERGNIIHITVLLYKCSLPSCTYCVKLNYEPNVKPSLLWLIGNILANLQHDKHMVTDPKELYWSDATKALEDVAW